MARQPSAAPEGTATDDNAANVIARPTLAQIDAAKRLISEEAAMATPMDEHIIHIALLLALNMSTIVNGDSGTQG